MKDKMHVVQIAAQYINQCRCRTILPPPGVPRELHTVFHTISIVSVSQSVDPSACWQRRLWRVECVTQSYALIYLPFRFISAHVSFCWTHLVAVAVKYCPAWIKRTSSSRRRASFIQFGRVFHQLCPRWPPTAGTRAARPGQVSSRMSLITHRASQLLN